MVTVQRNGASQEQIPLSQPSGDTATDSTRLGQKQGRSVNLYKLCINNMHACIANISVFLLDTLEGTTAPSDNSPFFSQPFFEPLLPRKVLPGMVYLLVIYLVHSISRLILHVVFICSKLIKLHLAPPHTVLYHSI